MKIAVASQNRNLPLGTPETGGEHRQLRREGLAEVGEQA